MRVYTLGYEKTKPLEYLRVLAEAGVAIVLDIRETPWSYNPPYRKAAMFSLLEGEGIEYKHLKECGNPSENRKTATSVTECLERYREHVFLNPEALSSIFQEIQTAAKNKKSVALTCFEKDHDQCHRSVLLDMLSEHVSDLEVINLVGCRAA